MVAGVVPIIAIYQLLDGVACVAGGILRVKGDQVGIYIQMTYMDVGN